MTVLYNLESKFGSGALKHLFLRWKGSVFKLVYFDLLVFLSFYSLISILYRYCLNEEQQREFEKISIYCEKYGTLIPVSFVLGFYVSLVIGRWWAQYKCIPWIDTLALWVNTSVRSQGDSENDRLLRRTICRYVCLSITQCFTLISKQVKKRFPSLDHLVASGLLMETEKGIIEDIVASLPKYQTHWIPLVWATELVASARFEGKINSDSWTKSMLDEINKIKDQCNLLLSFDRIRVPLVYTQVVTLAVYSYFLSCLMGRQWVWHKNVGSSTKASGKYGVEELDLVLPIFTILQFLFYIGWLKVAESLVNPFGDDDYDFELNWMVDRHIQVAYCIVDKMHYKLPKPTKDNYWDQIIPPELPHTLASIKCNNDPPATSTSTINISNKEKEIVHPDQPLISIATIAKTNIKFRNRAKVNDKKKKEENLIEVNGVEMEGVGESKGEDEPKEENKIKE